MSDAKFSFTKLVVADLDRATAFYTALLGFTEATRVRADITGRDVEEVVLAHSEGGPSLILLAWCDAPPPVFGELILGVSTSDPQGFIARALAAGGTLAQEVKDYDVLGQAVRAGFIRDCEGHLIEVVEMHDGAGG